MRELPPSIEHESGSEASVPPEELGRGFSSTRGFGAAAVVAALLVVSVLGDAGLWLGQPTAALAESETATAKSGVVFGEAERLAKLDGSMMESSGLAASQTLPGRLWTHGDSGGGPWLMRFDPWRGEPEKWTVRGASHRDWEDMASFRLDERAYLLLADTGDNRRNRAAVALHVLVEPTEALSLPSDKPAAEMSAVPVIDAVLTMHVTYEDGPRDCEAVAVDPVSRTVWLLSKEIDAGGRMYGRSGLYAVPLPSPSDWPEASPAQVGSPAEPLVLERVATLDTVMPTAMDLSADGRVMLIGTYGDGLWFERDPVADPDWVRTIAAGPTRVSLPPRRQGEGLCFDVEGDAFFLSSEKSEQPVWRIPISENATTADR